MALNRPTPESEGTRSARAINDHATRNWMPQPLLLKPEQPTPRPYPPLRLIKRAEPGLACGFGTCSLDPDCKTDCRYREAARALQSHYSSRHTQRAAMPPLPVTDHLDDRTGRSHNARRWAAMLLAGWCVFWLLAVTAWAF